MELTDDQIELLEKSYFGKTTETEQIQLEDWLTDDAFRAEAEAYLEVFERVDSSVENELRNTFRIWEKRAFGRQMMNNSWMKIAASFFLIAVIGSLVYVMQLSKPDDVSAFYMPYDNVVTARGEQMEDHISSGLSYYDKAQYPEAIEELQLEQSEDAMFYLAQCHFALKEYSTAIDIFTRASLRTGKYSEVVAWYEALCQYKLDKELGTAKLHKLAEGDSSYADEAADFLRQK